MGAPARQFVIAADNQPFVRELGRGDRRHVALVEQRHLQVAAFHQRLQGRCPQRGDPVETRRAQLFVDARLGDHAAIADQNHMGQAKADLEFLDVRRDGAGITGVAVENLNGDRTAIGRAQQTVDDLQLALLAVAVVAARG